MLEDVQTLKALIPKGETLKLENLCANYQLVAYIERYIHVRGSCKSEESYTLRSEFDETKYTLIQKLYSGYLLLPR